MVALCGLGGAGKTSVAVEYAHRHLAEVGVAWQFPAEDPAVLAAGFGELAAQLGAREMVDARDPVASVHAVLAAAAAGWLLVFDNAPDRASVQRFVPPAGRGRVLITSQNRHWPGGQALEVPVLDTEVAADFLVDRTGDPDRARQRWSWPGSWAGCRWRWSRPPRTCRPPGRTLAGYLALFRERRADLLARGEAAGYPADVAATWGWRCPGWRPRPRPRRGCCGCWRSWRPSRSRWPCCSPTRRPLAELPRRWRPPVGPLLGDPVAAGDAVAALRRYSLVTPAGDGLVLVHRLVQAITLDQLPAELAGQWRQAAAALVEAAIPADTRTARGLAGVRGAAAARPGCPRPDQRRHVADRAVPRP